MVITGFVTSSTISTLNVEWIQQMKNLGKWLWSIIYNSSVAITSWSNVKPIEISWSFREISFEKSLMITPAGPSHSWPRSFYKQGTFSMYTEWISIMNAKRKRWMMKIAREELKDKSCKHGYVFIFPIACVAWLGSLFSTYDDHELNKQSQKDMFHGNNDTKNNQQVIRGNNSAADKGAGDRHVPTNQRMDQRT